MRNRWLRAFELGRLSLLLGLVAVLPARGVDIIFTPNVAVLATDSLITVEGQLSPPAAGVVVHLIFLRDHVLLSPTDLSVNLYPLVGDFTVDPFFVTDGAGKINFRVQSGIGGQGAVVVTAEALIDMVLVEFDQTLQLSIAQVSDTGDDPRDVGPHFFASETRERAPQEEEDDDDGDDPRDTPPPTIYGEEDECCVEPEPSALDLADPEDGTGENNSVLLYAGEKTLRLTDLMIPGRGLHYRFVRTYRSRVQNLRAAATNDFAVDWAFTYSDDRLIEDLDNVIVFSDELRTDMFVATETPGEYQAPMEYYQQLKLNSGGDFEMRNRDGVVKPY
ncbi:MAG: hypothetical protein IID32_02590, partial [Planctomycetes bacterium]|nr:hypothetical protein [Planctomycetota bacterium]